MSWGEEKYYKSYNYCQLRNRERASDNTPNVAIERPELPFEVVNIDIIGRIESLQCIGITMYLL